MRRISLAPTSLQRLGAHHRRHAARLRTAARWLGFADDARDEAVLRCFRAIAEDVPEDSAAGWSALMRRLARMPVEGPAPAPASAPEAALLQHLRRLAPGDRAVFALAELGGFDATALARAIGAPPAAGEATIVGLRRAFAGDPAIVARGGPAAVLRAALDDDRPPAGWQTEAWQVLAGMFSGTWLGGPVASRAALVAVAAGLLVALVVLTQGPPPALELAQQPEEMPPVEPMRVVPPQVAPAAGQAPPLLTGPRDMAVVTGPERKVVVRKRRPRAAPAEESSRAERASAYDPGAVIVELEMLGAARKALAGKPAQALAYLDQHARDYPGSQLVDQRAELRVRALCALGRAPEARAEAQRRPAAKVQAALREACGG